MQDTQSNINCDTIERLELQKKTHLLLGRHIYDKIK